jgi:cytochrome P450
VAQRLPPGPRLPRLVQAWNWTYRYPRFTGDAHARYGPTFTARIGGLPTSVVTTDRDAVRRLFTGNPLVKRHGNDLLKPLVGEHSVLTLEPREHLARRKLLLPSFHGERMQGYERLMERLAAQELDRWRSGDVVEVQPLAQALTLDVILQAVLGIEDVALRRRLRRIFDAMINPITNVTTYIPQVTRRAWWNPGTYIYWRVKDRLDALLLGHIAATRADPRLVEREDVLAMLVQARDEDGRGLTDPELRDELVTLITAGHETTATAIAWGAALIARHPLAREDDAYLTATVKEILRIRSPIPIAAARFVLEPFPIDAWTIPPGVIVIVDAYWLHHDPAIYPEPEAFRPDRFLRAVEPAAAGGGRAGDRVCGAPEHAFLPFGGGAHRCLGASLAQLEMKVILRALLGRFELAPAAAGPVTARRRGVTLAPRDGGRVRVTRRGTSGAPSPAAPAAAAAR